jgi:hypothetical protein
MNISVGNSTTNLRQKSTKLVNVKWYLKRWYENCLWIVNLCFFNINRLNYKFIISLIK